MQHVRRAFLPESRLTFQLQMLKQLPYSKCSVVKCVFRYHYVWWFDCIARNSLIPIILKRTSLWKSYRSLWKNTDVNTFNMNVSVYQCYLHACVCIYSCNFLAFARDPLMKLTWRNARHMHIYYILIFLWQPCSKSIDTLKLSGENLKSSKPSNWA